MSIALYRFKQGGNIQGHEVECAIFASADLDQAASDGWVDNPASAIAGDQSAASGEDALRARYLELSGEEPDGRWGKARLAAEIAGLE